MDVADEALALLILTHDDGLALPFAQDLPRFRRDVEQIFADDQADIAREQLGFIYLVLDLDGRHDPLPALLRKILAGHAQGTENLVFARANPAETMRIRCRQDILHRFLLLIKVMRQIPGHDHRLFLEALLICEHGKNPPFPSFCFHYNEFKFPRPCHNRQ